MFSPEQAQQNFQIGDLVQAEIRSGKYAGEIVELYGPRAVVKVLAVLKHPEQGDLHHPYDPDVAMFHERPALGYTEKTTVLMRDLQRYAGELPDYKESLQHAAAASIEALERLRRWSGQSLELMKELQERYNSAKGS